MEKTYPRPALTADCCVFRPGVCAWEVLLIRRGKPPFQDQWALPGGFVNEGETALEAARRELAEETGVTGEEAADCIQIGFFDEVGRDPRGWVVSCAYAFLVREGTELKFGDDAEDAGWFPLQHPTYTLPFSLAFDHNDILEQAILTLPPFATAGFSPEQLDFIRDFEVAEQLRNSDAKTRASTEDE